MKDLFRILIFLIFPCTVLAQQYDYAKLLGGVAGDAYVHGLKTDGAGNVYVKGSYTGAQEIEGNLYRTSGKDAFISKFNNSGSLIWFKNVGFTEAEDGNFNPGSITVDANSNIYITGSYTGNTTIEGTSLTNQGQQDIYVIKYDLDGNFIWASSFGGAGDDFGLTIKTDASENVYIGGSTRSDPINFGAQGWLPTAATTKAAYWAKIDSDGDTFTGWIDFQPGNTTTSVYAMDLDTIAGDLFIGGQISSNIFYRSVKLIDGIVNWTQDLAPAAFSSAVLGLKSISGDLIITGYFSNGDIAFPTPFAPITLTNVGQKDIFLASLLSSSGLTNWAISYGGTGNEEGVSVDVNTSGSDNIFLTGNYFSSDLVIFGGLPLPQPGPGGSPFIAAFNDSPTPIAATSIQSDEFVSTSIELNEVDASIYLSGYYIENANLQFTLLNQKTNTSYVGSFNESTLAEQWYATSHKGQAIIEHMVVDNNDNLFLGGYFDGTINVMGTTIVSSEITTDPTLPRNDLFIAKMKPDETIEWIVVAGGMDADTLVDISYDGQGSVYLNARFTNVATIAGVVPDVMGKVIVKLDQNGNLIYAYQFDLPANSDITAIQGDNDIGADTLYMGGYYNGIANFQGFPTNGSNATDVFLVALDGNGNVVPSQVTSHGGEATEIITDMDKLPGGQLHITGWSNSPNNLAFDGLDLPIGAANGTDIFVVRFDDTLFENGGFIDGGTDDQEAQHITLDGLGNIIIAGELFDEGTFSGTLLSFDNTYNSYFIASYSDAFGSFNFANEIYEPLGGGTSGSLSDLNADGSGNIYLAGNMWFEDLFFDGITSISTSGQTDAFLAKYDVLGNLDFAQSYGGNYVIGAEAFEGYDYGLAMAVNSSDELWYSGTLAIKSEIFGSFTLQPAGSEAPGEFAGMDSYLLRLGQTPVSSNPPHMYWTENIGAVSGDDEIHRTDLDGNIFEQYYSGFSDEISGLVIDTANNRLYWTDAAQAEIIFGEIGPKGLSSGPTKLLDYNPSGANSMVDLVLDLVNGHIYFTHGNAESGFANKIARVNIDGTNDIELIDTGFEEPFGIDLDLTNNKIYYTTNFTSTEQEAKLYRANLDGTNVEMLALLKTPNSTPEFIRDVKIDPVNQIVYWSYGQIDIAPGTIYFNDLNEGAPFATPSSFTFPGEPRGIDLDLYNNKLYWVCRGANDGNTPPMIMRSNLDGSNIENIFTVTIFPANYPPDPPGSAFIALDLRGLVGGCSSPPTANAGPDMDFFENDNRTIFGAIGGGATSVTWTTSGDGTFTAATSVAPSYTPGPNDITNGSVVLTLTTDDPDGAGPCLAASDDMIITIEVEPPGVIVYNAVSPNGDNKHDYLEIENAEFFLENQVKIMNRWGDLVFEIAGYNNDTKKFIGVANKNGSGQLPSGTYYYNIVLGDGSKAISGFFSLRQ